jgi:glycerol uptake facilitator-like aquaporin
MNDLSPRLPQMLAAEFIGTFALIFFGPAIASGIWTSHWLYWVAPTLGALLAVGANVLLSINQPDIAVHSKAQ